MAILKDLTFDQVSAKSGVANAFLVAEDPLGNITLMVSVSAINEETVNTLSSPGVIKFFTRLREACHKAKETANTALLPEEKLTSFPPAISSGVIVDGYVEQTSTIKSRIAVSTATEISGTNP